VANQPGDYDIEQLRRTAERLERELTDFRRRLVALETDRRATAAQAVADVSKPTRPVVEPLGSPHPPTTPETPVLHEPPPIVRLEPLRKPPAEPLKTGGASLEVLIGGTWLNRIGALILLLGVGFFVKYSFDEGWISPTLRVLLGALTGAALIVGGEVSRRRDLKTFAVGLLGAGTATLYFSAFAAYYFYQLIPIAVAFALLSCVTLVSTVLAVHGNILAIAILTLIGGFWTPIALSTGQNAQVALLTYVLILDAGFLICGALRRWESLRVLTLVGTAVLFGGWYLKFYDESAMWTTVGFLTAFYVLYFAESQWSVRRGTRDGDRTLTETYAVVTTAFFACVYLLTREHMHQWLGLFCVATAALQLVSASMLRRLGDRGRALREAQLIAGLAMLALAAPLQFNNYLVPIAWGAQAVVTMWFCRGNDRPWLRVKAVGILLAAMGHLLFYDYANAELTRDFWTAGLWHLNWIIVLFVGLGLCAYGSAAMLSVRSAVSNVDAKICAGLLAYGSIAILGIFAAQYERYLATWCWLALALAWYAVARRAVWTGWVCVWIALAVCAKFLLWDLLEAASGGAWAELHGTLFNRACITGVLVAAMAGISSPLLPKLLRPQALAGDTILDRLLAGMMALACAIVILATGTFEIARVFQFEPWRERISDPASMAGVLITAWWAVNAGGVWLLFGARRPGLAGYATVLTWATLARFAIGDTLAAIGNEAWSRLSGICTNRVFVVGIVVIAVALLAYSIMRRARRADGPWFLGERSGKALLAASVLMIVWLPTFEIMRVFRFEPLRDRFRDPNLAMHVALSVQWSVTAVVLLAVGFARLSNLLRYMAIGLFGITVIKIFLVDLSHLEMVYRIVSFIVLGLLLLVASLLYQRLEARISPVASRESPPPQL